jgi:hypothetical protein
MKTAYLYIQCTAPNGETGDYLADIDGVAISPVFPGMLDLIQWARANDWGPMPFDSRHPVGTYTKRETS